MFGVSCFRFAAAMLASNSVSTIFKCISCSFGTCDQTAYAEHIKHCSSEPSSDSLPVTSDGGETQDSLTETSKTRRASHVCDECHLSLRCSKDLLFHLRDVHGKNLKIFVCRFCSHYAARLYGSLYSHVRRKHSETMLRGGNICSTVDQDSMTEKPSDIEAGADEHCTSKVPKMPCEQNDPAKNISDRGLCPVKSSRSLGLQFLGKQLPEVGRDDFICQLCSYSHVLSHIVVKHIWKEHSDKFEKVRAVAATGEASMKRGLYKCDDCNYSSYEKHTFYNHCAHHQFKGPSECPHCSFCGMTDSAISQHVQKIHAGRHCRSESAQTRTSSPGRARKRKGKLCRKWYSRNRACPLCTFRTKCRSALHCHKVRVHPELSKSRRTSLSFDSMSLSPKSKKVDVDDTVEMDSSCDPAEQQRAPAHNLLSGAVSTSVKQKVYRCDVCSREFNSLQLKKKHAQKHLNYRRYQCPVCGFRSNYADSIQKHISNFHKDVKAKTVVLSAEHAKQTIEAYNSNRLRKRSEHNYSVCRDDRVKAVKLSLDSAKQTKEAYRKHSGKQIHLDVRRYQCSVCGLRSNYQQNMKKHTIVMHKDTEARVIDLSLKDAKQTADSKEAYRTQPRKHIHLDVRRYQCSVCGLKSNYQQNMKKHTIVMHKDTEARVIDLSLKDAKQTAVSDDAYRKQRKKQIRLDLRRYQCTVCGFRSNYQQNIKQHAFFMHKDKEAQVITLSVQDAEQTIEEYRHQRLKFVHRQCKSVHSAATVKRNKLYPVASGKSRALQYRLPSSSNDVTTGSSEISPMQKATQPTMEISDHSYSGSGIPRPSERYACSVCRKQSGHRSSIYRHMRRDHCEKGRVIVVRKKMSVHKSKLAIHSVCKKALNSGELKAEASADGCQLYKLQRKRKFQQSICDMEHNYSSRAECITQTAVKSEMDNTVSNGGNDMHPVTGVNYSPPVPLSPLKRKVSRPYTCGICPFRAKALSTVIVHRRLHVKRSGYSFACSICPYFVNQSGHLERHMKLHARESAQGDKKPVEKRDSKFHLCDMCPYMTVRLGTFIYHKQRHRRRASAPSKCEHCNFWVSEPRHLSRHATVHTAQYMQERRKYSELPQTSDSPDGDTVETVHEKHKEIPASGSTNEVDGPSEKCDMSTDRRKLDEMMQSLSVVNDGDDETAVKSESLAGFSDENAGTSAQSGSSETSRQLPSWCCERCPYSASKLACFKRHMWLHGKQYPYECRYCDYSVQSYWQLVSHVLWHFAPNKHLMYAQSVSNLDSFPSQLPNRNGVPDSLASIDRFIPSFENSDVFLLSDAANFQCRCCPFVAEQRSEFFAHMRCHCTRDAAYSCPLCSFRTDVAESLSVHIFLHFNLPGSRQSTLPPNTCRLDDWKQLYAAIEALAERKPQDSASWSCNQVDAESSLKVDTLTAENQATRSSEYEDNLSVDKPHNQDDSSALSAMPDESLSAENQHETVMHSTDLPDVSVAEEPLSADSLSLVTENDSKLCRYCDRRIDDPNALVKHEARHLIGFYQPLA